MGKRLGLFGFLLAMCPAVYAVPLCTDYATISGTPGATPAPLQDYINLGSGGCTAGNTLFSGFSYNYTLGLAGPDTAGDPNVSASGVQVTLGGTALDPSIDFSADWYVSGGFQSELQIGYTVCVLNSSGACSPFPVEPLETSSTSFTGTVEDRRGTPGDYPSAIVLSLGLAPAGGPVIALSPSLYPSVCATPNTGCPTNSTTATVSTSTPVGPTQQVTVGDNFLLNSGGTLLGSSNTASLTDIDQGFADAPEPATLALAGCGLLLGGLAGWRKRRPVR